MINLSLSDLSDLVPEGLPDFSKLNKAMAAYVLAQNKSRYLQQVDPDGTPWVPSAAYENRVTLGLGGGTLFDTGAMYHAMHIEEASNGDTSINIPDDAIPYAKFHQLGQGQVQRTVLGISEADIATLGLMVKGFMERQLKG